jgi:hypothetical protein
MGIDPGHIKNEAEFVESLRKRGRKYSHEDLVKELRTRGGTAGKPMPGGLTAAEFRYLTKRMTSEQFNAYLKGASK